MRAAGRGFANRSRIIQILCAAMLLTACQPLPTGAFSALVDPTKPVEFVVTIWTIRF